MTPPKQLADLLRPIVRKHLPDSAYQVFIFGSRAEGTNRKFSDVDIGILGPNPVPSRTLFAIEDELEESDIPYLAQVIDFTTVEEKFKKVARSVTIPL